MKRTVSIKLITNKEQRQKLFALSSAYSKACNLIVQFARDSRCWNRVALHHLSYYVARESIPELGSQMICQAIHRVADAYKTLKANGEIKKDEPVKTIKFGIGSVNFDKRTYSIKDGMISLFTLTGRVRFNTSLGNHQRKLLEIGEPKESKLILKNKEWYFNLVVDIKDPEPFEGEEVIGIDVGENNLAATSTGKIFGGAQLRHNRNLYLSHRRRLQSNGSRASKRRLKLISGREQRHVKHVNHETSKSIVLEAVKSGSSIIKMEDLTHIRNNIKSNKRVRSNLNRWAFRQLQNFVKYKAEAYGMVVEFVNPAWTSQTCSCCQEIGIRKKHSFSCTCGFHAHADVNASRNIAGITGPIDPVRAAVNQPKLARSA